MIALSDVNVHDPEVETVVKSLTEYLNTPERMGDDVDKFYNEFPDANEGEFSVVLSAHTVNADHTHVFPVVDKLTPIIDEDIKQAATYRTGKYDIRIQVDIWAPYKAQRNALHKKFTDIINEDFLTMDGRPTGLSLPLVNYFDTIARYDIISYNFPDSERSSQEDEWRARLVLNVHFDEKRQKVVNTIKEPILVVKDTDTGEEFISETIEIGD